MGQVPRLNLIIITLVSKVLFIVLGIPNLFYYSNILIPVPAAMSFNVYGSFCHSIFHLSV